MLFLAAFFIILLVLLAKLLLELGSPCRNSEAIAAWAHDGRYQIRRIRPYPRPLNLRFGLSSQAQQFYLVEVVCPAGRPARYILKTGGYVLGRHVRKLRAFQADEAIPT